MVSSTYVCIHVIAVSCCDRPRLHGLPRFSFNQFPIKQRLVDVVIFFFSFFCYCLRALNTTIFWARLLGSVDILKVSRLGNKPRSYASTPEETTFPIVRTIDRWSIDRSVVVVVAVDETTKKYDLLFQNSQFRRIAQWISNFLGSPQGYRKTRPQQDQARKEVRTEVETNAKTCCLWMQQGTNYCALDFSVLFDDHGIVLLLLLSSGMFEQMFLGFCE